MNGNQIMRRWQAQNSSFSLPDGILIVAFLPAAVFAAWLAAGVEGEALRWCADLLLAAGAGLASLTAFAAAARYRGGPAGRGWAAIGAGMAIIAFGEVAWAFQELVLGQEVNSPSVADAGYLAFYVPVFAGLLMMPQAPVSGLKRLKLGLDLGVATAAIALLSSHFVITDLVAPSMTFGDWITVAYPVLDIFLVSAALVLLVRGGWNVTSMNLAVLALGFVAIGVSDSVYAYLSSENSYDSGSYIDLGWMVAYALIIVAGASAATRTLNVDSFLNDESHSVPVWRSLTLNAALIPVGAMLFTTTDVVVTAGFVALVALAFASNIVTHLEAARVNAQLAESAEALKQRVSVDRVESLRQSVERRGDEPQPGPEAWPQDVVSERAGRC